MVGRREDKLDISKIRQNQQDCIWLSQWLGRQRLVLMRMLLGWLLT